MENRTKQKNKITLSASDCGIAFDILVILMLIFSLVFGIISLEKDTLLAKILSYLCAPISIIGALLLLGVRKKTNVFNALAVKRCDSVTITAMLLITLGMIFGLSELNNIFVAFLEDLGFTLTEITLLDKNLLNVVCVIVFVCIIPAIVEEMMFRGAILKSLKNTGEVFAILFSGFLFSIFHMNPQQTIYQFIVGVLYALIVLRGGDWTLTAISHLINNLFVVLNYYFIKFYPTGTIKLILTILGLISLGLGVFLLIKNKKETNKFESKKNVIVGIPIGIIICVIMWIFNLVSYA